MSLSRVALIIDGNVLDRRAISRLAAPGRRSGGGRRIGGPGTGSNVPKRASHGHGQVCQKVHGLGPDRAKQADAPADGTEPAACRRTVAFASTGAAQAITTSHLESPGTGRPWHVIAGRCPCGFRRGGPLSRLTSTATTTGIRVRRSFVASAARAGHACHVLDQPGGFLGDRANRRRVLLSH